VGAYLSQKKQKGKKKIGQKKRHAKRRWTTNQTPIEVTPNDSEKHHARRQDRALQVKGDKKGGKGWGEKGTLPQSDFGRGSKNIKIQAAGGRR